MTDEPMIAAAFADVMAERWLAGDSLEAIAKDYGRPLELVERAVRVSIQEGQEYQDD